MGIRKKTGGKKKAPRASVLIDPVQLGRLSEAELTPAIPEKNCPNCGCKNPVNAWECCECPWEFGFST